MPIAKKKDISQDFLEQMKSNITKEPVVIEDEVPAAEPVIEIPEEKKEPEPAVTEEKTPVLAVSNEKKDKYADVMNVRLSKGRRNEIKAFCTNCGISVTQYIETSFEFLSKEVASGNITISKGGISKVAE